MIFETHAHYDDEAFNEDREAVIKSLAAVHAGSYIDNGFHSCSCKTFNYRLSVFIECLVIVVCM